MDELWSTKTFLCSSTDFGRSKVGGRFVEESSLDGQHSEGTSEMSMRAKDTWNWFFWNRFGRTSWMARLHWQWKGVMGLIADHVQWLERNSARPSEALWAWNFIQDKFRTGKLEFMGQQCRLSEWNFWKVVWKNWHHFCFHCLSAQQDISLLDNQCVAQWERIFGEIHAACYLIDPRVNQQKIRLEEKKAGREYLMRYGCNLS